MRKIKLYIATSLNGMIARSDGEVDWLDKIPHPSGEDYGYAEFYMSIDTTVMGNNTYKQVLGFDVEFPYKDKKNYVLTKNLDLQDDQNVCYISSDPINFCKELKVKEGGDIWLIGGGEVNTLFLNHKLIDEVYIHIMPYTIPNGIKLFAGAPIEHLFQLRSSKSYSSGVVELIYEVNVSK